MILAVEKALGTAVKRGLLGRGEGRRMAMLARLAQTLPDGAGSVPVVSGESLARDLGLSRAAVHKHVERLRSLGVAVESVGGAGYRLGRTWADLVVPEAVVPLLLEHLDFAAKWSVGLPYRYQARCTSTNLVLRQVAGRQPFGTVMVTDEQTGGRGRMGRTWLSEPGKDLTFSVLLRPSLAPAQAHLLSLAAALAVAETVEDLVGHTGSVKVKWPNDVLLDGRKVCGILLEGSMDADRLIWAIAGVGLNVNSSPAEIMHRLTAAEMADRQGRPRPVALREHLGHEVARAPLLAGLLRRLTASWTAVKAPALLEALQTRDALTGRRVAITGGPPGYEPVAEGTAVGMGPEGQLLVRDDRGATVAVFAGEVTVREMGASEM